MNAKSPLKLSPRQHEVMQALLQTGGGNKEVARELGIGVGTVEQYFVEIYQRLNVKTRVMAALVYDRSLRGAA